MKVAVVSPGRDNYSETFVRGHVERLGERVGEVTHLYGDAVPVWRDDHRALPPALLCALGEGLGTLFGTDGDEVSALLARQLRRGTSFREWFLARYLRRAGVDLVLAEFGPTGDAMRPVTARAGCPLVVHFHGYDAYRESVLARHDGYRALFRDAAAVVAVSDAMVGQLEALGADPARLHAIPYGVDLERFELADVPTTDPVLVAVGRFVDKKSPHLTIMAFAAAAEERPSARLVMAGDGPLRDSCRTLARGLGVADRVAFPGVLSHREVADLLQRGRAFVQHSVRAPDGDSEGNPVAVREAMASGLPVVATRHAGIPETVSHEQTGLLVDELAWREMASHMRRLLDDPSLAARLGRAGRERAEREFGMPRYVDRLGDLLEAAAEGTPPRS